MTVTKTITCFGLLLAACSGDDLAPPLGGEGTHDSGAGGSTDAANGGTGGGTSSTGGHAGDAAAHGGSSGSGGGPGGTGGSSGDGGAGGAQSSGGAADSGSTGGSPETGGTPGTGGTEAGTGTGGSADGGPADGSPEAEAAPCLSPKTACPGACVDLSSDHDHCGKCDQVCGSLEACVNGGCTTAHCGTTTTFAAEAELFLTPRVMDGGSADAAGFATPNRLLLATSGGTTLDAWVTASDGVYRAPGVTGSPMLSGVSRVLVGASQSLAVGKLDVGADLDLVRDSLTDVELLLGGGQGYSVAGTISVGDHEGSVLAVDIDGDKVNEVVVAALLTQDNLIAITIYKTDALDKPTVWRSRIAPLGGSLDVYGLAAGNFDHDGYRDIALAAYGSGSALVTFANSPTDMDSPLVHALPEGRVRTPLVFDFDNDGYDDVVAVSGRNIHFFAGGPGGLATDPTKTTMPEQTFTYADAAAADFDRDGKIDVALIRRVPPSDTQIVPAWGDAHGAFAPDFTQAVNIAATGIAAGDVNADGRPDLVTISADRGSVTAIRNACN